MTTVPEVIDGLPVLADAALLALSEACADELRNRGCAQEGHPPYNTVSSHDGRALQAYCLCGAQSWQPS